MAFRLRADESVRRGLRRLAKKELRSARERLARSLPPSDEAIWEARKSIKKTRAIAELIGADEGDRLKGSQKRLRRINRTLSELRDADAMVETIEKLRKAHPRLLSEHAFACLHRRLTSRKADAKRETRTDDEWARIDRQLRDVRRDVKRWRTAHRGAGALTGIRSTYRRGRKAMAAAARRQRAEDFHEWRKALKTLWYHLRLVEACAPRLRRDVRVLHDLERWLGDEHNLAVLCAELSEQGSLCDFDALRSAAERKQRELRRKTLDAAKPIYAAKPSDFLASLEKAWRAWHRRHGRPRRRAPRKRAA